MRKRRLSESFDEGSHGIDLAPMLDFVINLLIFFIITAVFVKESGLIVNRPTAFEPQENELESIQIQILSNGDIGTSTCKTGNPAVMETLSREIIAWRICRAHHDV